MAAPAATVCQLVAVPIWVGVLRSVVVPSPSWPKSLSPQAQRVPSVRMRDGVVVAGVDRQPVGRGADLGGRVAVSRRCRRRAGRRCCRPRSRGCRRCGSPRCGRRRRDGLPVAGGADLGGGAAADRGAVAELAEELSPQAQRVPSLRRATVWWLPAATDAKLASIPTGAVRSVKVRRRPGRRGCRPSRTAVGACTPDTAAP